MKKQQSGRSMVEMLGVLMVLAIVSVAGLVTYDYAKERWWETQLSQAISKVLTVAKTKEKNISARELRIALPKGIHSIQTEQVSFMTEDGTENSTPFKKVVITFGMKTLDCDVEKVCTKFNLLDKFGFDVSSPYKKTYTQGTVEVSSGVVEVMLKADKKTLNSFQK